MREFKLNNYFNITNSVTFKYSEVNVNESCSEHSDAYKIQIFMDVFFLCFHFVRDGIELTGKLKQ